MLAAIICLFPSLGKGQIVYELSCPSGFQPVNSGAGVTFNPTTGKYRANLCVDGSGNVTQNGPVTSAAINGRIEVDNVTYKGPQAVQSAIQACSAFTLGCVVDARNPAIGTQTLLTNPFAGLNFPIFLELGPYTLQWDHSALFVDFPSNFHLVLHGTTLLNSTGSVGNGINQNTQIIGANCFLCSRFYVGNASTTNGSATITFQSTPVGLTPGAMVAVVGASGSNSNQSTVTNGATGTGASFTVTTTAGWDVSGAKINFLTIDSEILSCTGGTGTTFTGCVRGLFGTTSVSHLTAVTVFSTLALVSEVLTVNGTSVKIADTPTANLTNANTYYGISNSLIEGTGTIDNNQTVATANRFENFLLTLAGHVTIGPGISIHGFDQGGITLIASKKNTILASQYSACGKPPLATGWDIGLFESSSNNLIESQSHAPGNDAAGAIGGDIVLFVDDRSTVTTIFDGGANDNVVRLGSMIGATYTFGVIIQSGSSRNMVTIPKVKISPTAGGSGVSINYDSDWLINGVASTTVTPIANRVDFGSIDATGQAAIATFGYTASGNNFIMGGEVIGGTVGALAGDYASYLSTTGIRTYVGSDNFISLARSAGAAAFPDVFNKAGQLVIAGAVGGSGDVIFGATTRTLWPEQAIANCTPIAAFDSTCADNVAHAMKASNNGGTYQLNLIGQKSTATCAASTIAVTFTPAFTSVPIVVVSDNTTSGGARVSTGPTTAGFTITCTGATDVVAWIAVANNN